MDRTDRFINNSAPKKLLLIFLISLAISACAAFFISDKCADRIVRDQIRSELSVAGGKGLTELPDEDSISAGEEIFRKYSINRNISPKLLKSYRSVRRTIFIPVYGLFAAISALWFFLSLRELMAIYRDLEALRNECLAAADSSEGTITLYGEDLGSVHRISDAAELLVNRLNNMKFSLSSEQRYLRTFLTDLSHQIKTSLAVVRLNTDMLT
ncbi:hypothetical protein [Ruminococcus flavefaciens]|uniref:hypothetical protein n=1 Tax=Ruminococcus flavefaciens TaxID=1265 RepID=UPI0026F043BA|nr:hypothetical protein [Ruminococcus flavefaciens]